MNKINFEDLPSEATPINAFNLNQVQDNVDNAKADKLIRVTTANENLNNYINEGTYFFPSNAIPLNIPVGQNGFLQVFRSVNHVKQIWYRMGSLNTNDFQTFVRSYVVTENVWSDWKEYQMKPTNLNWITAQLTSDFQPYSGSANEAPIYCKSLQVVELRGRISPTSEISATDTEHAIFTLPTDYRPSRKLFFVCQGSGKRTFLLTVSSNGTVSVSRYGNTDYEAIPTTAFLAINATFLVN